MQKVAPAGDDSLLLDRCAAHGLWFDAGELGLLVRRLDGQSGEAVVVGFLNETFTYSSTGGTNAQSKESNT